MTSDEIMTDMLVENEISPDDKNLLWVSLDFDDTICPSTLLNKYLSPVTFTFENVPLELIDQMLEIDLVLYNIFKDRLSITKIYIISYASGEWLNLTLRFYPLLSRLIHWKYIEVYSRDCGRNKYDVCLKLLSDDQYLEQYKYFMCAGDAPYDIEALPNVISYLNLTEPRLVSFKFIVVPTVDNILVQWKYIDENLGKLLNKEQHWIQHTFEQDNLSVSDFSHL